MASYQRKNCSDTSQRDMLTSLELTAREFERIAGRCRQAKIALIITPFGIEDIERIEALNGAQAQHIAERDHCSQSSGTPVAAIKIASTDLPNAPLVNAAAKTGLPLILSTGASTYEEILAAVDRVILAGAGERFIMLHCVSSYPTPLEAINLRAIGTLQREFGVPVGLSDHTTSIETGGWAAAAGACAIEKHFTLDQRAAGPDHAMSLTPKELAAYIRAVRDAEKALGNGELGVSSIEEDVRRAARKSVVAAKLIAAGTRITSDMLTLKRPGTGIGPEQLEALLGREAKTDIPSDTLLSWQMVK
jgi:N-acetylneuraminate synthase/N,N'-diacetyllegionaminate synthase